MSKNNERNSANKNKKEKDREEYGYGYDRSVDDLKVLGQNQPAKKKTNTE